MGSAFFFDEKMKTCCIIIYWRKLYEKIFEIGSADLFYFVFYCCVC
jgi:hypothetical protein